MTLKQHTTPKQCSVKLLKKLQKLGVKSDGTEQSMEKLICAKGYGLPGEHIEIVKEWVTVFDGSDEPREELQDVPRHYFGFSFEYKHMRLTLTYADALAEELILLKEFNKL